jgi:hypothetical protein
VKLKNWAGVTGREEGKLFHIGGTQLSHIVGKGKWIVLEETETIGRSIKKKNR